MLYSMEIIPNLNRLRNLSVYNHPSPILILTKKSKELFFTVGLILGITVLKNKNKIIYKKTSIFT